MIRLGSVDGAVATAVSAGCAGKPNLGACGGQFNAFGAGIGAVTGAGDSEDMTGGFGGQLRAVGAGMFAVSVARRATVDSRSVMKLVIITLERISALSPKYAKLTDLVNRG